MKINKILIGALLFAPLVSAKTVYINDPNSGAIRVNTGNTASSTSKISTNTEKTAQNTADILKELTKTVDAPKPLDSALAISSGTTDALAENARMKEDDTTEADMNKKAKELTNQKRDADANSSGANTQASDYLAKLQAAKTASEANKSTPNTVPTTDTGGTKKSEACNAAVKKSMNNYDQQMAEIWKRNLEKPKEPCLSMIFDSPSFDIGFPDFLLEKMIDGVCDMVDSKIDEWTEATYEKTLGVVESAINEKFADLNGVFEDINKQVGIDMFEMKEMESGSFYDTYDSSIGGAIDESASSIGSSINEYIQAIPTYEIPIPVYNSGE